jgi:hypothetical protein
MGWFGGTAKKTQKQELILQQQQKQLLLQQQQLQKQQQKQLQQQQLLQQQSQQQQQPVTSSTAILQQQQQPRSTENSKTYVSSSHNNPIDALEAASLEGGSYVNPATVRNMSSRQVAAIPSAVVTNVDKGSSPALVDTRAARETRDDEVLMIVDRPPNSNTNNASSTIKTGRDYDLEDFSKSFSREDYAETEMPEETRATHLNSLFNGHLMKWKFEAEEGSAFIRVPAFFGALGLITTAIVSLVMEEDAWTSHSIVMSVCVIIMSMFVVILDGRFLSTNPLSARAHLRNIMTRNFNIFRFLWGRGLLYMTAGILNVAQLWLITVVSGGIMILIGFIAVCVGIYSSRKFSSLRNSLADESFLLLVFSTYDDDGDGYLVPYEFALLLADLGMELDDRYTLKAFNVIDTDNDRRISFDEFSHWWTSGYIERGRRRRDDETDDGSYRRLD